MTDDETRQAVLDLWTYDQATYGRPYWIPVLRAACRQAKIAENYGGRFAGSWVLSEMARETGEPWRPGLRVLVTFGLLQPDGPATRGGRRRYYRMANRELIEKVLRRTGQPA